MGHLKQIYTNIYNWIRNYVRLVKKGECKERRDRERRSSFCGIDEVEFL
jgi:hypothetical protein